MRNALLVLAAAVALVGCTRTVSVQIRNPAQAGVLEPNRVVHSYARREQHRGLPPGTLNEEASLVSYEPRGACFDVLLNNLEDSAELAALTSYEIRVTADGEPLPPPDVMPTHSTATVYEGLVPQTEQTGTTTECVRRHPDTQDCEQWDTRPVYSTFMVPGPVTVVTGGGKLCVPNNGGLSPYTQEVAVEFNTPRGVTAHRFRFRWEFVGVQPPPEPSQNGTMQAAR